MNDQNEYIVESIGEQMSLMFWTCFATLTAVGAILWVAM